MTNHYTMAKCFLMLISCLIKSSSTAFFSPYQQKYHNPHRISFFPHQHQPLKTQLFSFVADGSDYSTSDTDYEDDDDRRSSDEGPAYRPFTDAPTIEEQPVPKSKNAANRFVAFIWDNKIDKKGRDWEELFDNRIDLNADHVMYCRKANLYNETFNYNSMVDVVWSYPLLSTDLGRIVGHAMCLDSTALEHVHAFLSSEPIIQSLTDGDISSIPLYRWRHMKDHTLRQDDGRFGMPYLIINFDRTDEEVEGLRAATNTSHLEYLIKSERVVQAGPLHVCTEKKDDPDSVAVGSIVVVNAENRSHAIEFAENDPCALAGLYDTIHVHRYNDLDVSGKFVLDNIFDLEKNNIVDHMKDAMEEWGYPVEDTQTPWINS